MGNQKNTVRPLCSDTCFDIIEVGKRVPYYSLRSCSILSYYMKMINEFEKVAILYFEIVWIAKQWKGTLYLDAIKQTRLCIRLDVGKEYSEKPFSCFIIKKYKISEHEWSEWTHLSQQDCVNCLSAIQWFHFIVYTSNTSYYLNTAYTG